MEATVNGCYPGPVCQKAVAGPMIKVLFIIDTLQVGGAEQSLLENATRFEKITPIICHLYSGEKLKPGFLKNNIKVHSLGVSGSYGFFSAFKRLRLVIEDEKPVLMVAYLTRSEIVTRIASLFTKVPVVGTFVNDLYCDTYNKHLSWKAKKGVALFKLINKITSRVCIGFVANSEAIKESNAHHLRLAGKKIVVINRGRSCNTIIRKNFNASKTSAVLRFINVSRLFAVKGHHKLILGFKQFLKRCPNATLDIAGDGPLFAELQQLIADNNLQKSISLLGTRNDVESILHEYDCFVFPSLMEGFSGAIVEAMFAGLPVLATDIPQNREAITHLQTGYLFLPDSADEIENAFKWFKSNRTEAQALSINAYRYAKENFEQAVIVKKFENHLLTLIPTIEKHSANSKTSIKRR